MSTTWVFDAPTGTYKNHELSSQIFEASIEETHFVEHALPVGMGTGKGESTTLTRVRNVTEPTSATLTENVRIPEDEFNLSTKQITPQEIGRSIPYSNLYTDLSHFNVENAIQRKLMQQMRLTLDTLAATGMKNTQIKYQITGASAGTFTTNGSFGGAAAANMNVYHAEEIRDYLFDTLHAGPAMGGDYLGIFRTLGLRGIKRDDDFEKWHFYVDPAAKFNSEVGRLEQIRFMETNHANALGKVGTSSVLGEGVIFGEDFLAMAEIMTPELRAAQPDDFGRSKGVAWYGNIAFDMIWDTGNAGEAKGVHIGST